MTTQNLPQIKNYTQYIPLTNDSNTTGQQNVTQWLNTLNSLYQQNYFNMLYYCIMTLGSVNLLSGNTLLTMGSFLYGLNPPQDSSGGLWDQDGSLYDVSFWDNYQSIGEDASYQLALALTISRKYGVFNPIALKQMLVEYINEIKVPSDPVLSYSQIYVTVTPLNVYVSMPATVTTESIFFWLTNYLTLTNYGIVLSIY